MAKATGILKIEGTIEDLTFYKKDGKNFVKRKSAVSKERLQNDPSYVRTRENNNEFKNNANSGKVLRLALNTMVYKAKDNKLSSRMLQLMNEIKKYDDVSVRGQRNVALGIATAEGKLALKGFDFNANAPLKSMLFAPYLLDTGTGIVKFTNLVPGEQVHFPQGATHFSLQCAYLVLDFATGISEIGYSGIENLPLNFTVSNPTLTPASVPTATGTKVYLLMVSFYQEVNGVQYSLKNEEYNVLHVMEVL